MTSQMAPRRQRTSLTSAMGGRWKCRPRMVPAAALSEVLHKMDPPCLEPVGGEFLGAEEPGKEAAAVAARLKLDAPCAGKGGEGVNFIGRPRRRRSVRIVR